MTYEEKLYQIAQNDDRIIVMTAENRAAIRNLPDLLGDRFIDTGITEQTLIGSAAGLALRGRIPVVHALASFLTMRAFEFIRTDVGISQLPVKLIGYVPGFLSEANGPTHQAIEDIALMRSIPGMRVFAPADLTDLLIGLPDIVNDPHPWYIRYTDLPTEVDHKQDFEIGKSEIICSGTNISIFVYGFLFHEAFKAAEILKEKDLGVKVINMRTLEPFDMDSIIDSGVFSEMLVTIEDHFSRGGLYSILIETLYNNNIKTKVLPLNLKDKWFKPALISDVLKHEGFDAANLSKKIYAEYKQKVLQNVQQSAI